MIALLVIMAGIWWINSKRIRRAWVTKVTSHTIKMMAGLVVDNENEGDNNDYDGGKPRRSDLLVEWV